MMPDVTKNPLTRLCIEMHDDLEQALVLGWEPTPLWHEKANCKGANNRYWDTGHPSSVKRPHPSPGDPDWDPCNSIFDTDSGRDDPRLRHFKAAMNGYKYSVAMGICGACDVRIDCGLAAVDEEPQPWAQYLIRGGVTAAKRGKLMELHETEVSIRPAVLYKRLCERRCGAMVGSRDPDVLECRDCRNIASMPQAA